ncbi:MAG: hypothetical protein WCD20_11825 [Rhodomicrobium sp.]
MAKQALEAGAGTGYFSAKIWERIFGSRENLLVKSTDLLRHCSSSSAMELFGMKKQLVWVGKVFSNRLFAAICLLFALHAYATPSAPKCDCPCAKDKKQASVAASPTGQVTVVWTRDQTFLGRTFHSKIEVQIDTATVGTVDFDAPLTVSVPNGPHKLVVKQKNGYLDTLSKTYESQITVSAQKPLYFQVIDKGLNIFTSELDAATALALLSSGPKIPSGIGTIYFYWPKPGLNLGFLDQLNTDLPVYLDGKLIGAFTIGDYVVVKAPSGEHVLSLDMSLSSGQMIKHDIILEGGSTHYFRVEKRLDFHILEDSPQESAEFAKKGLRQREVSAQ